MQSGASYIQCQFAVEFTLFNVDVSVIGNNMDNGRVYLNIRNSQLCPHIPLYETGFCIRRSFSRHSPKLKKVVKSPIFKKKHISVKDIFPPKQYDIDSSVVSKSDSVSLSVLTVMLKVEPAFLSTMKRNYDSIDNELTMN